MKVFTFEEGPQILVHFHVSSNQILKVELSLHSQFEVHLHGDLPLKNQYLLEKWLKSYSLKKQTPFEINLLLSDYTPFQREVWQSLTKIPFGETCSYLQVSKMTSSPKAVRAVGSSCKKNPFPFIVPCHRVIRSNKTLGEFNGGVEIKKRLLSFEGALI
ncbi:MAG: Methylated-DNA--protein-cysteine methyltransferase [Chlamydiae bacterium]|nr:Methylated-DNA--protein-cysteine methyltransferase [Chlamydiota bacterium]